MRKAAILLIAALAATLLMGCGDGAQQGAAMDSQQKIDAENKARGDVGQE
jgi:hypothetical protein